MNFSIPENLLPDFEAGLDPQHPTQSAIPARVLGYGEISTVIELSEHPHLAFKRMPMFIDEAEIIAYEKVYHTFHELAEQIGLNLITNDLHHFYDAKSNLHVAYITQEKLPVATIGNQAIHHLPATAVTDLVLAILREANKVYTFNRADNGWAIGFDIQISNWAIADFDPFGGQLPDPLKLIYFDTSSPLIQQNGQELLDPELFLRSAPSFLVPVVRALFLEDVITRYYDQRKVTIDLLANLYKEQMGEMVPDLLTAVNRFYRDELQLTDFAPLTIKEIESYYREDAFIWRLYLALRKLDRTLHQFVRKTYPYILPEKIKR